MVQALTLLIGLQLIGEVTVRMTGLPLPGPVLGMALLFGWLQWRSGPPPEWLSRTASGLLENLGLLFVPAGVGIMLHLELLSREWAAVVAGVLGLVSHGIGTSRALNLSAQAGAFASLAMALNALATPALIMLAAAFL